ncbi:MAG: type III secretion protein J [Chlamydiales bacterium]|jgi:type III secretion protein J
MSNLSIGLILSLKRSINFLFIVGILLPLLSSCGSSKIVVHDVEEKEANEIIVFLSTRGIEAGKATPESTGGGGGTKIAVYNIVVDQAEWVNAMRHLDREGLPRRKGTTLLKLFGTAGLVPSEQEEKIRFRAGKEEELANTIRKIDGIIDADVQLSLPDDIALTPGMVKETSTASVYVKHQGVLDDPNSHLVTKIKRWIASSIPGLDFENVTVIADRARASYDRVGEGESFAKEEQKEYVKTWGVVLAKESVSHFQMIFFSFGGLILLFLSTMGWLFWKISPLIKQFGGMPAFFTTEPFRLDGSIGSGIAEEGDSVEGAENKEVDDDDDDDDDDDEDDDEDKD